ncbi:hypothetical protein C4K88_01420 [Arthrobacter pityocampae]|uniref:Uncharacterized protein n=1 Tax=Arthrobacter pityocampae TaxID=547334 RepID=A0A2S5J167_9MICC|nr:hypothetical protein [Arthrobacter pityocampae]PPB50576.1 hypothetical protein C4K88_01420 [Arthrobacter pityocampae]
MTTHRRFPQTATLRTVTGTAAVLLAGAVLAPAAALAVESEPAAALPAILGQQQPRVVEQPQPGATFGEPAPPVVDSLATSGTDPATGFAINARTGFLVHPGTGHLIEPGTGNLVYADTLIYTNLRYDAATGEVGQIADEAPAPAPSSSPAKTTAAPSPSATPSATATATATSSATATAAPSGPTTAPAVVGSAPTTEGATASSTPRATRSATPTASATAAAEEERAASLAPIAWIGGALLAVAVAVVAVLAARRRRH